MKIACTIFLELLTCGVLFAGQGVEYSPTSPTTLSDADKTDTATAPYVIFTNLDSNPGDRFSTNISAGFPVAGRSALGNQTERWDAIRFSPKADVQATTISAAIGYIGGTKLVNLGIYTNNETTGSVGTLLPGGQATSAAIPALGQCCQLTRVTLPGEGVSLTAGTLYWLVASPDNVNAPDFRGQWQTSNLVMSSSRTPPSSWQPFTGIWPAAEIRGTQTANSHANAAQLAQVDAASASKTVIFSDLGRNFATPVFFGAGAPLYGADVPSEPEIWQALPFTPRSDVHATTLAAAIAWKSGTKLINLGVYGDDDGKVGTRLPGGQASTTNIPDLGTCCELTQVRLPGTGVQLLGGVQYWLVASTDDISGPTFDGAWQNSSSALNAYQEPENFINWTNTEADLLAAEIRGTSP